MNSTPTTTDIKIAGEQHIGKFVLAAGCRWNAKAQVWEIPYGEVMDPGLEKRLVRIEN